MKTDTSSQAASVHASENGTMNVRLLREVHSKRFGQSDAPAFLAPGRVNLIGEHTDYAGGFVLPAAIDFGTIATISARKDNRIELWSQNFSESVTISNADFPQARHHWSDYPLGVIWSLREAGVDIPPFSMCLWGNVPVAAGLSSSASLEVATAAAALHLAGRDIPRSEVALLCQRAENVYVGSSCGIMDQFIAANGAEDHALLLDCRSLQFRLAPIPHHISLVIANTMVKHSVAGGEYGNRRAEVEEGTAILRSHRPEIQLLRDATPEDLARWGHEMPDKVMRRCRHIITENLRTVAAANALQSGDLKKLGRLMAEAHASYRDDFEASCREADIMVDAAQGLPGLVGARLTGGGFGGCTVNLVESGQAQEFSALLRDKYKAATGIEADIYRCHASAAAHEV
ncbi:MAG TPA: galactokinase [Acidobacteriaceae bacterium]|nr:galactokinase [Acidobacteriaceae bacterium]